MIDLQQVTGFDWDEGNRFKNEKHSVKTAEVEQVFFNQPLVLIDDPHHSSTDESRYHAFGASDKGRLLHITFTVREQRRLLRPISARPMSRKERTAYAKATQASA